MPTQEERLSALEQTLTVLGKGIRDLNHSATILLGVTSEQGRDIREMKVRLAALDERFDAFEQSVSGRFDAFEQSVSGRFDTFEQSVSGRFDEQGKKLDQIMLLLNTLIPKPE